jgi:hydrogenase maturation protein HypF
VADAFVMHDRPIVNRLDDSVLALDEEGGLPLRRARGYVPAAIRCPCRPARTLAMGAS